MVLNQTDNHGVSPVDQKVEELWESVVATCNRVISQSKLYGFQLMSLPDPNIHKVSQALNVVVCPLLDKLTMQASFSPESGMKIANIKQYNLHLREIVLALDEGCVDSFAKAVEKLSSEAMLI